MDAVVRVWEDVETGTAVGPDFSVTDLAATVPGSWIVGPPAASHWFPGSPGGCGGGMPRCSPAAGT